MTTDTITNWNNDVVVLTDIEATWTKSILSLGDDAMFALVIADDSDGWVATSLDDHYCETSDGAYTNEEHVAVLVSEFRRESLTVKAIFTLSESELWVAQTLLEEEPLASLGIEEVVDLLSKVRTVLFEDNEA